MKVFAYDQGFIEKWHKYEELYDNAPDYISELMERSLEQHFGWVPDSVKVEPDCIIADF